MWIGIDTDAWASLWGGLLGSIPAAAIAAYIAIRVFREGNKQQDNFLIRQFMEQRASARKEREFAAVADFVAVCDRVRRIPPKTDEELQESLVQMNVACLRLSFELEEYDMREEVLAWPYTVYTAAKKRFQSPNAEDDEMLEAWSSIRATFGQWPTLVALPDAKQVQTLKDLRSKIDRDGNVL